MVNLFNKGGRCITWSQKSLFNKWGWESWAATCNTVKLDHQLTPNTKINSMWIKDLHRSRDIIKVLGENISKKIWDVPRSNTFTNMSPRARDLKQRWNKWDFIKIKSFGKAKENSIKMKRDPTIWENIFANDTSDKGLIYKKCKNSHNSTPERQTIQLKSGQRTWTDTSPRKTYRGHRERW